MKSSVLFEVQSFEVGSFEVGSFEAGLFEVGSFQVRSFEVGLYEVRSFEVQSFEVQSVNRWGVAMIFIGSHRATKGAASFSHALDLPAMSSRRSIMLTVEVINFPYLSMRGIQAFTAPGYISSTLRKVMRAGIFSHVLDHLAHFLGSRRHCHLFTSSSQYLLPYSY